MDSRWLTMSMTGRRLMSSSCRYRSTRFEYVSDVPDTLAPTQTGSRFAIRAMPIADSLRASTSARSRADHPMPLASIALLR
jgi:hypothetical protein